MKNSYNFANDLLNGGIVSIINNKKNKLSKRYLIVIGAMIFYLLLIGLCFINGINSFDGNKIIFTILIILGIVLIIDLYRFYFSIVDSFKIKKKTK